MQEITIIDLTVDSDDDITNSSQIIIEAYYPPENEDINENYNYLVLPGDEDIIFIPENFEYYDESVDRNEDNEIDDIVGKFSDMGKRKRIEDLKNNRCKVLIV